MKHASTDDSCNRFSISFLSCKKQANILYNFFSITVVWWCAMVGDRQRNQSKGRPQQTYGSFFSATEKTMNFSAHPKCLLLLLLLNPPEAH